jgi:exopolysaccharide biosynthesis protein
MILSKKVCISFAVSMFFLTSVSCQKSKSTVSELPKHYSALTQRLVDSAGIIATVFSDTSFEIADGVSETDIHYLNMQGYTTRMFILRVDLNNPDIKLQVATPFDATTTTLQTVPDMAKYIDKPGHHVVAGVNGDFFNTTTYKLMGIEYKNGMAIKDTFTDNADKPQQGLSFFAVLSNGKPYIGEKGREYDSVKSMISNATGGGVLLVKNYSAMPPMVPTVDPRTAVGYTAEGIVYFIVVDGRDFFYSNGIDYEQLTKTMVALKAENAINLDGGGSSILMIANPLADVWQVRNHPADGAPRAIVDAWMVISTKE